MTVYRVKRPYIAADGSLIEANTKIKTTRFEGSHFFAGLLEHDFIEEVNKELPHFSVLRYSELANLEIADRDYVEGDKKHFTFDEAMEIEKKYKEDGWRLPTRSEWVLICKEFGQNNNGELDAEVLEKGLKLEKNGIKWSDGDITGAGIYSLYWSRSGAAATTAYNLAFAASGVYPSYGPNNRYYGFSLRFVRDRK